ncbi:MAG TPA: type II toxin-antitoxin system Phd/YefM family antitoxin [Thermodesulfobacteriota bacterium]|nr:type II toxin-antitoxin system Phd/YefM family antitoxin [Thermodesulfobacteriota bacterium]
MKRIKIEQANMYLDTLIDEVTESDEPILIEANGRNSVLVSEQNWRSIQETLYLLSIPKMRESIRDGMAEPLDDCKDKVW